MWYPFKSWVVDWRRICEASRLRRCAQQTPNLAERATLLWQALQSWPTDEQAQLDLAIVLARQGEANEAAHWWREAIRARPSRVLTEEQYTPLLPLFPLVAREALSGLEHCKHWRGWKLVDEGHDEPNQRWSLTHDSIQRLHLLQPTLRYIVLLISHCARGPGRVTFECWHRGSDDTDALGESVWEWTTPREVRCILPH